MSSDMNPALFTMMQKQLSKFTVESDSVLQKHCLAGATVVDSVLSSLQKNHGVTPDGLRYLSDSGMIAWPPSTAAVEDHYRPFVWLLNIVLAISNALVKDNFHRQLRFSYYGRPMSDGLVNTPLNPAILGCQGSDIDLNTQRSWQDVDICVEVGERWDYLMAYAGLYALCCFYTQERLFVTGIHFNVTTMEVRIGFYTHAGLVTTIPLTLTTEEGFRTFIAAVVGMNSWSDACSAGIDPTRSGTQFTIPSLGQYNISETMYKCTAMFGPAMKMYRLIRNPPNQAVEDATADSSATLVKPIGDISQHGGPIENVSTALFSNESHDSTRSENSRSMECDTSNLQATSGEGEPVELNASSTAPSTTSPEKDALSDCRLTKDLEELSISSPSVIILKDYWKLSSQCDEGLVFQSLNGNFGLPFVIKAYPVAEQTGHVVDFLPDDISQEDKFDEDNGYIPEKRTHTRVVYKTGGTPLHDARGPRALVEGIIHAMLGHYVLFRDGTLHCDVNPDIVRLMDGEERTPVTDFSVTKDLTRCFGFISDGDRAIQWRKPPADISYPNTPPFMSILVADYVFRGYDIPLTAIDDLESFIWVLFWTILNVLKSKNALKNPDELCYYEIMHSGSPRRLLERLAFLHCLREGETTNGTPGGLAPFHRLLIQWLELADEAQWDTQDIRGCDTNEDYDNLFSYSKEIYERYLTIGLESLPSLPDNWDYLFAEEEANTST